MDSQANHVRHMVLSISAPAKLFASEMVLMKETVTARISSFLQLQNILLSFTDVSRKVFYHQGTFFQPAWLETWEK